MHFLNQWVLTILLLIPLGGAVAVGMLRRNITLVRRVALGTTVAACAVSVLVLAPFRWRQMLSYDDGPRGSVKLAEKVQLPLGAEYYVAVDGISFPFLFLVTLLFSLLCAASWRGPSASAAYFATLLISEFATLGTYVSFDFLLVVAFMALAVAGVVVLSRIDRTDVSTIRLFAIYMCAGIVCLVAASLGIRAHVGSFDALRVASTSGLPSWILLILVIGFLIRMAAFPVHAWLATVYGRTTFPVATLMTCIIPVTGAYGLMRLASPLSPSGSTGVWAGLEVLGVVGFLFGALCAMASEDLRSFIAYSTVSLMGCVLFAVSLRVPTAFDGAEMILLGHTLAGAMIVFLAGADATQPTGERPPLWTAFFSIAWVAWLVVPLFAGQAVVMLGAFEAARNSSSHDGAAYGLAIVALFGVLANGAAAARMARRIFLPSPQPAERPPRDLSAIDVTILSVLGGLAILLGVFPGYLCYTYTHPAARALLHAN